MTARLFLWALLGTFLSGSTGYALRSAFPPNRRGRTIAAHIWLTRKGDASAPIRVSTYGKGGRRILSEYAAPSADRAAGLRDLKAGRISQAQLERGFGPLNETHVWDNGRRVVLYGPSGNPQAFHRVKRERIETTLWPTDSTMRNQSVRASYEPKTGALVVRSERLKRSISVTIERQLRPGRELAQKVFDAAYRALLTGLFPSEFERQQREVAAR
jgi:hypothetical protein